MRNADWWMTRAALFPASALPSIRNPKSAFRNPSKSDLLDHADPVVCVETVGGELSDHFKDVIREAADVENVRRLGCLHSRVGLDVNAGEARARVTSLERGPLLHRRRAAATARVNPRLVVRDVDDEVALGLALVQETERRAAIRAAAADSRELLRVRHQAVAR